MGTTQKRRYWKDNNDNQIKNEKDKTRIKIVYLREEAKQIKQKLQLTIKTVIRNQKQKQLIMLMMR